MMALLMALQIVLGMFDILILPSIRLSFGFLAVAATGMLYGPVAAGLQAALGDILVALFFPKGAFFPGLTLSALLGGVIYGLVLYKKPWTWLQLLLAKGSVNLFINILLNTYWLSILQGAAMGVLFWPRVVKNLVLLPLEVALLFALSRLLQRLAHKIPM
jgi:ECF transporter S component (folate family)